MLLQSLEIATCLGAPSGRSRPKPGRCKRQERKGGRRPATAQPAFPGSEPASGGAAGCALSPTSRPLPLRAAALRALLCADGGCHLPARSAGSATPCAGSGARRGLPAQSSPRERQGRAGIPRSATERDPETLKKSFGEDLSPVPPRNVWNFLDHLTTSVPGLPAHNHQTTTLGPGSRGLSSRVSCWL